VNTRTRKDGRAVKRGSIPSAAQVRDPAGRTCARGGYGFAAQHCFVGCARERSRL